MPVATFLGHSCFLLEYDEYRIIIDPFLSGNPQAKTAPEDIEVDYILLTHGHGDHLGDSVSIAKANDATVIAPFELANYCEEEGCKVHPMHIGGAYNFPFGRVKLTIAHHGSALPDGRYAGNPCGFLVTLGGHTIYHPGDTGLFYDMKLIGEMNNIDLAVLPIGDNFTMGAEDALKAVEFLDPKSVIPMHYKTFDIIDADPQAFVKNVMEMGKNAVVLEVGESFEF
jgi:L-ascorbate metabolism protein UlaG (beta-lactamase superfamily)